MGQYVQIVPVKFQTGTVAVGSPVVIDTKMFPFPLTITAIPAGGSLTVAYSTTPGAAGSPGTAVWTNWPAGTVTANTTDALISPVAAIRFTAATATGTYEVNG